MANEATSAISGSQAQWPPAPRIENFIEDFWRWHLLIQALSKLASEHLYGDRTLHVAETDIVSLISYAEDREREHVAAIAKFKVDTASQLKSKAEVLLASYEAEDNDILGSLVRSLAGDLVRIPLREYSGKVGDIVGKSVRNTKQAGRRRVSPVRKNGGNVIDPAATASAGQKGTNGKLHEAGTASNGASN